VEPNLSDRGERSIELCYVKTADKRAATGESYCPGGGKLKEAIVSPMARSSAACTCNEIPAGASLNQFHGSDHPIPQFFTRAVDFRFTARPVSTSSTSPIACS
jgi:hypothetical protein